MNFDAITINWGRINSPGEWLVLITAISVLIGSFYIWKNRKRIDTNGVINDKTIKTLTDNNSALEERVKIVEAETKECHNQHAESLKLIHTLQGEIKAYKDLALVPKDFLKELQRNQTEIIKLLKEFKKK